MRWDNIYYEKWKNSVNTLLGQGKFLAPQKKIPPDKEKMKLKSTAVYNGTIFGSSK